MAKNILDSDASENEADDVELNVGSEFKVNEEFAKRFTHNKKREELARCKHFPARGGPSEPLLISYSGG